LTDRPHSRSGAELPLNPALGPRPLDGHLCQAIDLGILGVTFLGITISPVFDADQANLAGQPQLRVWLRDLLIAIVCIFTWRMILVSVGLYDSSRLRSIREYILRFFIGLNCCTAVVGLIELVLRTGVDVWRLVAIYWAACLVLMATARVVLVLIRRRRGRLYHQWTNGSRLE